MKILSQFRSDCRKDRHLDRVWLHQVDVQRPRHALGYSMECRRAQSGRYGQQRAQHTADLGLLLEYWCVMTCMQRKATPFQDTAWGLQRLSCLRTCKSWSRGHFREIGRTNQRNSDRETEERYGRNGRKVNTGHGGVGVECKRKVSLCTCAAQRHSSGASTEHGPATASGC